MTSTSRAQQYQPRGCFGGCVILTLIPLAALVMFVLYSLQVDPDSPIARMYRTEADLRALMKAVDTYHAELHTYPPAGPEGLRAATDYLSRKGHYLPGGPPPDGWNRTFTYVPSSAYEASGTGALRTETGFFAPDTYQIYSTGADGDSGRNNSGGLSDNIVSWDPNLAWRAHYESLPN